jgi:hypothetical protein
MRRSTAAGLLSKGSLETIHIAGMAPSNSASVAKYLRHAVATRLRRGA